jgi:hypothetical protein
MKAEEFVDAVRTCVMKAAVVDTLAILEKPPGRKPAADLVQASEWFRGLSEADRKMIERVLTMVSGQAVFGVLAVLDDSRKVDPAFRPGDYFELRHIHDGATDVLSGPNGAGLHELL